MLGGWPEALVRSNRLRSFELAAVVIRRWRSSMLGREPEALARPNRLRSFGLPWELLDRPADRKRPPLTDSL